MKIKLLIFGLLFCISSLIANEALGTYKFNPYTRKLDYYEAGSSSGSGTVTSVDMSVPTGLLISGNPITTSGTLSVTYDTGYEGLLTTDKNSWNTTYNYVNQDVTNGSSPTFLTPTISGTLWDGVTIATSSDILNLWNLDSLKNVNTDDVANGYILNYQDGWTSTSTLFIDESGNVGIGTTNPSARLHINYPTSGDVIFQAGTGDGGSDMNMRYGYNGYGWYNKYLGSGSGDNNEWQLWSDGSGSTDMQVYGIKQSGNITFMKDMTIEGTLTLNTPLTDAYVSDDLTVNGYMEDTDIDTFAELQSWVSGYTDNDTQLSQEQVEDYVGGMTSGTETHIAVTYDDTSGNLNYVVSDDWYDSLSDLQSAVSNDFHNLGGIDANTEYTAGGTLLDLTGTTFSLNEGALTDTKLCTYEASSGLVCNHTDADTTYTSSDFNHDDLTGYVANEHIDWTTDQGATNIHSGNYTDNNTTYTGGDGLTLTGTDFDVDEELYTEEKGVYIESPVVESLDELFGIVMNNITITYVYCNTDTGTVTMNIEDGSANNILSAELVCDAGGQTSCASGCDVNTINASYDNITAKTEAISYDASAVASDPTKVTIIIGYTKDD